MTRSEDKQYSFSPGAKVWKGVRPGSIEQLQVGDEVIQQLVEQNGKLTAVEIVDRKGDDAVRAAQDLRHREQEERLGLPAYVTDLEVLSGSLTVTVAWNSAARARVLVAGQVVAITPTDGSKPFAGAIVATRSVDSRQRLELAINSRVAARLAYGQPLRLFLPGAGPEVPAGRSGVPASAYK